MGRINVIVWLHHLLPMTHTITGTYWWNFGSNGNP